MICKRCGEREATTNHVVGVLVDGFFGGEDAPSDEPPTGPARPLQPDLFEPCLAEEVGPQAYAVYSLVRQFMNGQLSHREFIERAEHLTKPQLGDDSPGGKDESLEP